MIGDDEADVWHKGRVAGGGIMPNQGAFILLPHTRSAGGLSESRAASPRGRVPPRRVCGERMRAGHDPPPASRPAVDKRIEVGRDCQPVKKRRRARARCQPSSLPASSRIECIPYVGTPTSTVSTPIPDAVIGPIVLPQPMSLRTTKRCTGASTSSHNCVNLACVRLLVA